MNCTSNPGETWSNSPLNGMDLWNRFFDPTLTPDWMAESNQAEAQFGNSVSNAGDVNGDDYDDVMVGAPFEENGEIHEGQVSVYYGSSTGPSTEPDWQAEGNQYEARFGYCVSVAGDVSGDSFDDLLIGANLYNNGQNNEGAAFEYHGSSLFLK